MSGSLVWCICASCAAGTALLVGFARRYALQTGLLDVPNARSSHTGSVPRGGGIAIVVIVLGTAAILTVRGQMSYPDGIAWLGGGLIVALIGYLDDHRDINVGGRLLTHALAGFAALYAVAGLPALPWGQGSVDLGAPGWLIGILLVVWSINLFNFMDGIDGIAAQQALFMAGGGWLVQLAGPVHVNVMLGALCGSAVGFMAWNWAPARIFMGDVGSGFLGFALALVALISCREGPSNFWTWLILGGLFVADATMTLVVRLARGARVFSAHREHVYQRMARRVGSHARVSLGFFVINVAWLLPWAVASTRHRAASALCAAVALTPILIAAFFLGAGRREEIPCNGEMR